jgi:hypothetical protein
LVFGVWCFRASAELPAPDNILYGNIVLDSQPITATNTNIVVEARRSPNGAAIASYRMGSSAQAGDGYILKIPLEELSPLDDSTNSSLAGASLYLTVRDESGARVQLPYQIPERGYTKRVDFGSVAADSDSDGLPDAWELAYFGNLNQNASGDPDGDGHNNMQEFLEGTNPNDPNDVFRLTITKSGTNTFVSFFARKAEGVGFEGYDRIYALEYSTNLFAGWLGVPARTNILGTNGTFTYQTRETNSAVFYRGSATLRLQ